MKFKLDNPLRPVHWVVLATGVVLAVMIYGVWIHPSLELVARLDEAREARTEADEALEQAHATFQRLQQRIRANRDRLEEMGGTPPPESQRDFQIARLTALAGLCDLAIDQYVPVDSVVASDHLAFHVQFIGRGSFAAIQEYFRRVETEVDFVDITHFSINSANSANPVNEESTAEALASWSCRINTSKPDAHAELSHAGSQTDSPPSREVAWHGQ
jgi:hypothetical protein